MRHHQRGHLFRTKLKSGELSHWKITFRDATGKSIKITVGPSKHQAAALLRERLDAIYQDVYPGELRPTTFRDYAQKWITGRAGIKPGTRNAYEAILGVYARPAVEGWTRGQRPHQLVNVWGAREMASIRLADVNTWLATAPLRPKTKRNALVLLSTLFADAVEDHVVPRHPFKGLRGLQRPKA